MANNKGRRFARSVLTFKFRDAVVEAMKTFFQNSFVRQPDGPYAQTAMR